MTATAPYLGETSLFGFLQAEDSPALEQTAERQTLALPGAGHLPLGAQPAVHLVKLKRTGPVTRLHGHCGSALKDDLSPSPGWPLCSSRSGRAAGGSRPAASAAEGSSRRPCSGTPCARRKPQTEPGPPAGGRPETLDGTERDSVSVWTKHLPPAEALGGSASPGLSFSGCSFFFLWSDSTISTALLKAAETPDQNRGRFLTTEHESPHTPADVQSFPGVSGHGRHFSGTELDRRGVQNPFARHLGGRTQTKPDSHREPRPEKLANPNGVYLCQPVLHDGRQLVPAVGSKVQQQGATVETGLQPRQDPVRQVQSVGDTCRQRNNQNQNPNTETVKTEPIGAFTDETEAGLGQERPFKDGVEDVLSFAVQLVHLVQNQEPEENTGPSGEGTASGANTNNAQSLLVHSHCGSGAGQEPLQAVLPPGGSEFVGQQREDGVRAPQTHAVHRHGLDAG